ncbi:MAG: serine/threonine protein kinase, partial [Proteobacteria bacterium]
PCRPARWGRYLVSGPIGRGGMGTVFEGEHVELGRPVAIKVLSPEQAKKRNATQRFQVEARTAGAIGHPNICEVYDMGMLPDGCPYLVMERLSGNTLQAKLGLEKKLSIPEAIDILRGVLAGLAAAHEKNVVHRDIKPENIFLCTDPVQEVKLVDFGVAKIYGDDAEDSELNLTRTGMVMGTPYYMSSEQARGQRNLDARVDVYAAGVVLYECLAGVRPYVAPNYNALLVKIIGQDAPPLSGFRPDVSPELERIVQKSMMRSRKQRFQSALDFRDALEELVRASDRAPVSDPYPSIDIDLEQSGMVPTHSDVHPSWDAGEDTIASSASSASSRRPSPVPVPIPDEPSSLTSLED